MKRLISSAFAVLMLLATAAAAQDLGPQASATLPGVDPLNGALVAQIHFTAPRHTTVHWRRVRSFRVRRSAPVHFTGDTSRIERVTVLRFRPEYAHAVHATALTFRNPTFQRPSLQGTHRTANTPAPRPAPPSTPVSLNAKKARSLFTSSLKSLDV
jgi:hypothetical protein